jgi:hypothetical protein
MDVRDQDAIARARNDWPAHDTTWQPMMRPKDVEEPPAASDSTVDERLASTASDPFRDERPEPKLDEAPRLPTGDA